MTGFNLKHFPDVCRLCFKAAESAGKMYSIEGNFEKLSLDIQSFLDKFTFPVKKVSVMETSGFTYTVYIFYFSRVRLNTFRGWYATFV